MPQTTETPTTPAAPPTATEIADRVLKGIESAAGTAGAQAARVWPEMVRARQAEGCVHVALAVIFSVVAWRLLRALWKSNNAYIDKEKDDEKVGFSIFLCVLSSLLILVLLGCFLSNAIPHATAVVAPEGQYVREIVRDALGK